MSKIPGGQGLLGATPGNAGSQGGDLSWVTVTVSVEMLETVTWTPSAGASSHGLCSGSSIAGATSRDLRLATRLTMASTIAATTRTTAPMSLSQPICFTNSR